MQPHPQPYPPQHTAPKQPVPGQSLAIAVLVAAAAILVAALLSKSWATWTEGSRESGGFGLSGAEFCERGICASVPTELLESSRVGLPGDVSIWGMLGMLAALAGAAGAGAMGIMILTRKTQSVAKLGKPALMALGAAGFLCTFYLVRLLTASMKIKVGPGWAAFVGIGGLVAAGVIVQRIQKQFAYASPQFAGPPGGVAYQPPMQAPMQAAPAHPCPRCQRPLVFVAQYQRWFCESCQQYA